MQKKWWAIPLAVLVGVGAVVSGGGYWFVKRAVTVTSGEIRTGVGKPVRIERDSYGVPHIYAQNERDLLYAQGYAQAEDRMWQMEMSRLAISGKLTEAFGAAQLQRDKLFRTIGFKRVAEAAVEKLPARTKASLQAFADGVNAYLADHESRLPVEYAATGYKPEPWTIADSLAIAKYMAWDLGGNMRTELFMSTAVAQVGKERALQMIPAIQEKDYGRAIPAETAQTALSEQQSGGLLGLFAEVSDGTVPGDGKGSNNWVVAGSRSASGKPLLANDMHLALGAPSIFYQNHLNSPDGYNVTGAIFPGVPGVIVGHNDEVTWGFTNLMPDVQDLYVEKPNPDNPHQFEYNGRYEDATVIHETYKIKGQDELATSETVVTRHGPIITDIADNATGRPLALRWTALDFTDEITAMLGMDRARSWNEFESAIKGFEAPAQNVVFADRAGNIAYRAIGRIPIRKNGLGVYPAPGWTDAYEWTGYIPWEEMPHKWNPDEGFVATANNKVYDDSYKYQISLEFDVPYRSQRIAEMIQERGKLDITDLQEMQNDFYNGQAARFVPEWIGVLEKANLSDAEKKALATLREYAQNPVDAADATGPTIFHTMLTRMYHNVLKAPLGGEALFMQSFTAGLAPRALDAIIAADSPKWLEGTGITKESAIVKSFQETVAELEDRIGSNQDKWTWGTLHTITFAHPLGSVPGLNLLFNDGPHPYGGSGTTVGAAGYTRSQPYQINLGAPWRYTIDMADPAKAQDAMEMGASGQLGSAHYKDQTTLWLEGRYKDMPFTESDVKTGREAVQTLQPK